MKRVLSILTALSIVLCLASCGDRGEAGTDTDKKAEITTVAAYIDEMKKSVGIGETTMKDASLINAAEGVGFTVNSKKFELYKFSDKDELTKAKSGTYKFTLKGLESMGELSMQSTVNGEFVLLYEASDEAVIKAFSGVKL